jgi:hypothetical protein
MCNAGTAVDIEVAIDTEPTLCYRGRVVDLSCTFNTRQSVIPIWAPELVLDYCKRDIQAVRQVMGPVITVASERGWPDDEGLIQKLRQV